VSESVDEGRKPSDPLISVLVSSICLAGNIVIPAIWNGEMSLGITYSVFAGLGVGFAVNAIRLYSRRMLRRVFWPGIILLLAHSLLISIFIIGVFANPHVWRTIIPYWRKVIGI
jgi:multidrug transporter EmrE-like cation transporter